MDVSVYVRSWAQIMQDETVMNLEIVEASLITGKPITAKDMGRLKKKFCLIYFANMFGWQFSDFEGKSWLLWILVRATHHGPSICGDF